MEDIEHRPPIGVEPDVLPVGDAALVAVVGNGVLGEVERVAVGIGDHLVHGGAHRLIGRGADLERGDLDLGLAQERVDQRLDMPAGDQRLVPLDIDVDVGHARPRHFPQPIRPRRMRRRRHHGRHVMGVTDLHHLIAVGRHQHIGQERARPRPIEDVHHHGQPRDLAQHLPRQPRRRKPGRNHPQEVHAATLPELESDTTKHGRPRLGALMATDGPTGMDIAGKRRPAADAAGRGVHTRPAVGGGGARGSRWNRGFCALPKPPAPISWPDRVLSKDCESACSSGSPGPASPDRGHARGAKMGDGCAPGQRPRSRGSSTSRSASPSILKPNTASEIASPGQMAIQGARYMYERPEPESMAPQDG